MNEQKPVRDGNDAAEAVASAFANERRLEIVGRGSKRELGRTIQTDETLDLSGLSGIVLYEPEELVLSARASTPIAEIAEVLGRSNQELAFEPIDYGPLLGLPEGAGTLGGAISAGLSGPRRIKAGAARDFVLGVSAVSGRGEMFKAGGRVVKNVTGYDLPRLLIGSLGTIGVITRVILRCQPRPVQVQWLRGAGDPDDIRRRCFRPSAVLWGDDTTTVLLEGHPEDLAAQAKSAGLDRVEHGPDLPEGSHRGRASVAPTRVRELGAALSTIKEVRWLAESGVGTVHVAADTEDALRSARAAAKAAGGWLLREAGAPGLDGFGVDLPNAALMLRVKDAFDPTHKLSPGRLTFPERAASAAS
jgi:glycolate oxidase FAD binding subunit